jgi:hypothetical protein
MPHVFRIHYQSPPGAMAVSHKSFAMVKSAADVNVVQHQIPDLTSWFKDGGDSKCQIELNEANAVSLFRVGVEPAWEDPSNASGTITKFDGKEGTCSKFAEAFWAACAWLASTSNEGVCGVKIIDKTSKQFGIKTRVEIWWGVKSPKTNPLTAAVFSDVTKSFSTRPDTT